MNIEDRLAAAGVVLPVPPRPGGAYEPTTRCGNMLFVAAQFPIQDGSLRYCGRLGDDLSEEDGYAAARLAAINVLAQIHQALGGWERLRGLVRLDGYLQTTPDFGRHARVLDGASELFNEVLGEKGRHVRTICGQVSLPRNLPVELAVIAEISE